jgi:hypothetical protein
MGMRKENAMTFYDDFMSLFVGFSLGLAGIAYWFA